MSESETWNGCCFTLDESSRAPLEDEFEIGGILRCPEPVREVRITGAWPVALRCEAMGGETDYAYRCLGKHFQSCLVEKRLRLQIHLQSAAICSLEVEIAPPDPSPFRDIFSSGFRFPEKVCLIAPGPSAAVSVRQIPPDYARLAVNKAVLVPGANADYWVMNQLTTNSRTYFESADASFHGTRIFRLPTAWFWRDRVHPENRRRCFWFSARQAPAECITAAVCPPLAACVRSGATVAGCALQVLANLGAKEILLCGLDMSGGTYWDGTTNIEDRQTGIWRQRDAMGKLLKEIRDIGLKVQSMTQTR